MIRELEYKDFDAASSVLWRSFYFAEKNVATMEGMELFRDVTSPVSLSINSFEGKVCFFGTFENEMLVAVGAIKNRNHILLLYVLPEYQKNGIGKRFLKYMESRCESSFITLNASDFALDFYRKMGYAITGERREENGLFITPMKKDK